MRYNRYLYRLPVQVVPITDIVKNSISSAGIVTDPIIGISLLLTSNAIDGITNFNCGFKFQNADTVKQYEVWSDNLVQL